MPFLFLTLICCCQDMTNELPTFDPVTVNENTIVLANANVDYKHQILLFDVSADKILYTYAFNGISFCEIWFDFSFNEKIFIDCADGRFIELDIPTGKTKEMEEVDFQPWSVVFLEGYMWVFRRQILQEGLLSQGLRFSKEMESELMNFQEILPRGKNTALDNHVYISYSSIYSRENGIYDYTNKKKIDITEINPNDQCIDVENNFLWMSYEIENNNNDTAEGFINDVYRIDSFEPLVYQKIITTPSSLDVLIFNVFENNKDVFLYCRESIVIVDKQTKQITKQVLLPDAKYVGLAHCRNGFIWCCAEKSDGVYKFDMNDYSLKVIH